MSARALQNSRADYQEGGVAITGAASWRPSASHSSSWQSLSMVPAAPFEIEWLRGCFDAFLSMNGAVPLERCLRLPTTIAGWRRSRRDGWLIKAATLIEADDSPTGSAMLREEWNTFISRGPWQAWRDDSGPPRSATPLYEALFWASRFSRSKCLGAKQIERIAGHIFTKKCR